MQFDSTEFKNNAIFLVTGGAGFIGANICEKLLKMGYNVRCLDNFSTGKHGNIKDFIDDKNFQLIEGDVINAETCLKACEGATYVLHQAARGSVPGSIDNPVKYCSSNIVGTVNLLDACVKQSVEKFVYASSSAVYGDTPVNPNKEGHEGKLLSPYALTKLCNEQWAAQYTLHYGLDTYGLRYFNVFGEKQDCNGAYAAVIPKFIKQLLHNESPTIYGDGKQTRDFTYIQNVVEANLAACKAPSSAAGKAYNIAFGEKKSLLDIYDDISSVLQKNIKPMFSDTRKGDIKHSSADISSAKKFLGYEPNYSFKDGIERAIEWYKIDLGNKEDNTNEE